MNGKKLMKVKEAKKILEKMKGNLEVLKKAGVDITLADKMSDYIEKFEAGKKEIEALKAELDQKKIMIEESRENLSDLADRMKKTMKKELKKESVEKAPQKKEPVQKAAKKTVKKKEQA